MSSFEITIFEKSVGILSKQIRLDEAGNGPVSDGSSCTMREGVARRKVLRSIDELGDVIREMGSNQALSLGSLARGLPDEVSVTTAANLTNAASGSIARTKEFLVFEKAGYLLIDFDLKGMPDDIRSRLAQAGGLWPVLENVCPKLAGAARVTRSSTSSGLENTETGEKYIGSGGLHIYVPVLRAADIPRALQDLSKRLWLAGFGWILISNSGQLLTRCLVDGSVGSPERLVFEGAPKVVAPLTQCTQARVPQVEQGSVIESELVIPPLNAEEEMRVRALQDRARSLLASKAAEVRQRANSSLACKIAATTGISLIAASKVAAARHNGELLPALTLEFDHEHFGIVTVADVLMNPSRFVGETLADPLEGLAYGRCKAMVLWQSDGQLIINSYAHGGCVYRPLHDFSTLQKLLEETASTCVVEVVCRAMVSARLQPDEEERLLRSLGQRSGLGHSVLKKRLKKERYEARCQKSSDLADARPKVRLPRLDDEFFPTLLEIDSHLRVVGESDRPLRNASHRLCAIRDKSIKGLCELGGGGSAAPMEPVIQALDHDEIALLIEKHVRFSAGEEAGRPIRLHLPFVRAYAGWSESVLPRVHSVASLPILGPKGDLLRDNGVNEEFGIYFKIDEAVIAGIPRISDVNEEKAQAAYTFLRDEWLVDVAAGDAGKAITIALALTLIQRAILPERPAFMVSAGQRGGGKTTLLNMVSAAVLGRRTPAAQWSDNVEERRKALFACLREGASFITFDNIPRGHSISCPHVEAALTQCFVSGRVLGATENETVSSTSIIAFTGNNISPKADMCSRTLVIQLQIDRTDPEERAFKHAEPIEWTIGNRVEILSALYTILLWNAQCWKSEPNTQVSTRFKSWMRVCGTATERLARIRFRDLFSANETEDGESATILTVLKVLQEGFGDKPFSSADVASAEHSTTIRPLLEAASSMPLMGGEFSAQAVGQRLKAIKEKPVKDEAFVYTLKCTSQRNANVWSVLMIPAEQQWN